MAWHMSFIVSFIMNVLINWAILSYFCQNRQFCIIKCYVVTFYEIYSKTICRNMCVIKTCQQ